MPSLQELGVAAAARLFHQHCEDGTERWMTMTAAYDLRDHPRNYGIHGCELVFGIKRGGIAVVLNWSTDFHLPKVRVHLENSPHPRYYPSGLGGINYHSPVPLYEGQSPTDSCEYTGGKCYSDGTSLGAGELFDKAVADPALIWPTLLDHLEYREQRVREELEAARNFT